MRGKYIRSGDDGTCACGTCHVPSYQAALDLLERGLTVALLVEEPGVLAIGYASPTLDQLELAMGDNRAIRGAYHVAMARRLKDMEVSE